MKLIEVIENLCVDIDESKNDITIVKKLKIYIDRAHKEAAKREKSSVETLQNDDDLLQTFDENIEFIYAYAKYLYYQSEEDHELAEIYKRDFESYDLKRKVRSFKLVRI